MQYQVTNLRKFHKLNNFHTNLSNLTHDLRIIASAGNGNWTICMLIFRYGLFGRHYQMNTNGSRQVHNEAWFRLAYCTLSYIFLQYYRLLFLSYVIHIMVYVLSLTRQASAYLYISTYWCPSAEVLYPNITVI